MSWTHLTLVSDKDVGTLEPEAVHSDIPWGAQVWSDARMEAKRDLQIWLEADYVDVPNVCDHILDRWTADYVWAFTGSAYTDVTSEARNDTDEDLDLATIWTTPATDALYVGADYEFEGVFVRLLDSLNATTSTLSVSYWNGGAWTALTITDGTTASGKTCAGSGRVLWTLPTAWERRDVNATGAHLFWVRLMVSAALTAGTAASQILPIRAPLGLKRVAAYLALSHVCNGLSAQAASPEYWAQKATTYWDKATALYARLREHGGIPIDLDKSQAIQPSTGETASVTRVVLRRG